MATELGQAYVQIMPSAKGISGSIQKELSGESVIAGKSAGSNIVGALKGVIATAAIGKAVGAALTEGGDLQQSLGGVETLFKENAEKVKQYANEAYKTAGLSANAYMENVTSFSASLLQSMEGDTDKAADKANMAMIDMSDNANKMGTSMEMIQNAYQGFAKQNYTMLDNLKLGYGGTKSEMERLLADAEKLTGTKYDIENLADVYDAIHAVQVELGITGTTAKESAETLSGSLASMKGAFANVLGNLALGKDITPSLKALAQTTSTFLFKNLLPMVGNIISALPGAILTFIQAAGPAFMESGGELFSNLVNGIVTGIPLVFETLATMMSEIVTWVKEQLPTILENGVEFISNFATGIFDGAPSVIDNIGEILNSVLTAIFDALPMILESGMEIISNLAKGIWDNLPAIIKSITNILANLLSTIIEHLPEFLVRGIEIVTKMAIGLVQAIPDIVAKVPLLIGAIIGGIGGLIGDFVDIGADLVKGLWKGILSVKDWILDKISGFVSSITDGIKSFFGISSPSKLMADDVGRWLPIGLAAGIEDNIKPVSKAMELLGEEASDFDIGASLNVSSLRGGFINNVNHSGTIRVEGVNNRNELIDIVDIVMDQLRREVRA